MPTNTTIGPPPTPTNVVPFKKRVRPSRSKAAIAAREAEKQKKLAESAGLNGTSTATTTTSEKPGIGDRAILMHIHIKIWSATAADTTIANEVASEKHAKDPGAYKVFKTLVRSEHLNQYKYVVNALRDYVYKVTSPWFDGGMRIMPTAIYDEVMDEIARRRRIADEHLATFIKDDYRAAVAEARSQLGSGYKESDYPSEADIGSYFGVELRFMPIPSNEDWRVANTPPPDFLGDLARSTDIASWRKLATIMHRLQRAFANEDRAVRSTLIPMALDLCNALPTLNMTGNPEVEKMCANIKKELEGLEAGDLKKDSSKRKEVAPKVNKFASAAAGFLKALDPTAKIGGADNE